MDSKFQPIWDIQKAIEKAVRAATDEQIDACYWLTYEDGDTDIIRNAFSQEFHRRFNGQKSAG